MIAPQILVLSIILSVIWLPVVVNAAVEYRRAHMAKVEQRRLHIILALRWFIAALCVFIICSSYVLRTAMVLAGFGESFVGQIVFFALLAPIFIGGLFCLVSLKYD